MRWGRTGCRSCGRSSRTRTPTRSMRRAAEAALRIGRHVTSRPSRGGARAQRLQQHATEAWSAARLHGGGSEHARAYTARRGERELQRRGGTRATANSDGLLWRRMSTCGEAEEHLWEAEGLRCTRMPHARRLVLRIVLQAELATICMRTSVWTSLLCVKSSLLANAGVGWE